MSLKNAKTRTIKKIGIKTENLLRTPWFEEAKAGNTWKEYPRPSMVRKDWINLNGWWDYAFTDSASPFPSFSSDRQILLPFSPECELSGVMRQLQPEEYLWYHRQLRVPACKKGWHYLLHFGAVDQDCTVYINGREMLTHHGGYLPFDVDLDPAINVNLDSVANVDLDSAAKSADSSDSILIYDIILRVKDVSNTSYYSRGKQKLKRGGMFYTAQSGIWQTVWMEMVPDQYISYVKITPDYDHSCCHVKVSLRSYDHRGSQDKISLQSKEETSHPSSVREAGKKNIPITSTLLAAAPKDSLSSDFVFDTEEHTVFSDHTLQQHCSENPCDMKEHNTWIDRQSGPCVTLHIPQMHPWSPEDPYLYRLIITAGEDQVECYVGMRIITKEVAEDGHLRFFLNHKECIQLGVLDQGYWPDGLYTAPSDEALIYDIRTMKDLGCNMIRKHIKIEPDRWYYHCDRLGMLVWQDMVNGGSEYQSWFVTYLATVLNTHHISIQDGPLSRWLLSRTHKEGRKIFLQEMADTVKWLYNHPCIITWVPFNESWGQFDATKVAAILKKKDPTRLVDHASGWFDQKVGDIISLHYYFFKLRFKEEKERVLALTEFGGYSWKDPEHSFSQDEYGYGSYESREKLLEACHSLMRDTIWPAVKGGVSALIYTQLSDIEDEHNGILTYDRKGIKIPDLYQRDS